MGKRQQIQVVGKTVLLVSPEKWGAIRLSKHHYATALAQAGASVYFLEPADALTKQVKVREVTEEGITVITHPKPMRGKRFLPGALRRLPDKRLLTQVKKISGNLDLVWSFDAYQLQFLDRVALGTAKYIFQLMDFPHTETALPQARYAHLSIGVTPALVSLLQDAGAGHTMHFPHAYAPRPTVPIDHEGFLAPRPYVACLGNMSARALDRNALTAIADAHPEVSLFLIGPFGASNLNDELHPDRTWLNDMVAKPNVYWTDAVHAATVPSWLAKMDGLLIAYDAVNFGSFASNSHKLLEYLATGKPVLSSHLAEAGAAGELVTMVAAGAGIDSGFAAWLPELSMAHDTALTKKRMDYAMERTYSIILVKILVALNTEG